MRHQSISKFVAQTDEERTNNVYHISHSYTFYLVWDNTSFSLKKQSIWVLLIILLTVPINYLFFVAFILPSFIDRPVAFKITAFSSQTSLDFDIASIVGDTYGKIMISSMKAMSWWLEYIRVWYSSKLSECLWIAFTLETISSDIAVRTMILKFTYKD